MITRFILVAAIAAVLPVAAHAQVSTFTDKVSFNEVAGALALEDFNGITADTSFENTTIAFSAFTLSAVSTRPEPSGFNFIDVPPLVGGGITPANYDVDGTALANMGVSGLETVTFTFIGPISAFGVDLRRAQNLAGLLEIVINGDAFQPPVLPDFYGLISSTPFTSVTFRNVDRAEFGDGFGLDNVLHSPISTNVVPEPMVWAQLIAGFALVGAFARRRRRTFA